MRTDDFDYTLPAGLIAQSPLEPRDHSRLMVLRRADGTIEHRQFYEIIDFLQEGDVLVFNDSRVIPARLSGRRVASGGKVEVLLLRRQQPNVWEALVRPGKRLRTGSKIDILPAGGALPPAAVQAEILEEKEDGIRVVGFSDEKKLPELGTVALPPYIHRPLGCPERYQTVYARCAGSVAAPTAGLHFTPELLAAIREKGVRCLFVTLHIGLDTFRPVPEDDPREHPIHSEYASLSPEVAEQLSRAKQEGRRIICVGTTAVRVVEQAAQSGSPTHPQPFEGWVTLFILPGHQFRMVDALVTNFHLPRSTLLMLVSAFAGRELILRAYREAIDREYRFYSFGDAMLVL